MKKIILLLFLTIITCFSYGQSIFPQGNPTGKVYVKGLLQADTGIRFGLSRLNPFPYTRDSFFMIRINYQDSLPYYSKNGLTWHKLVNDSSTGLIPQTGYGLTTAPAGVFNFDTSIFDLRYWENGGNTPVDSLRGGTKNTKVIALYNGGRVVMTIDSNFNFRFISKAVVFDRLPIIQAAFDTSKYFTDIGFSNKFIMGSQAVTIGQLNYQSGGGNTFQWGQSNATHTSSASNRLFQFGTSNNIGDSTIDNNSDVQIGRLNNILNVGSHVYFSTQIGISNLIYSLSPTSQGTQAQYQFGAGLTDSAKWFQPQFSVGTQHTNRNQGTFMLGIADSVDWGQHATSWEDYQLWLISSGSITGSTGAMRNAFKFLRTGQLMLGKDTVQLNGEWLRVPGKIGSDSLKNTAGNSFVLSSDQYGNIIKIPNDTSSSGYSFVSPSQHGAIPDFKRLTGLSFTKGSKRITSSTAIFVIADVGKIMAVKNARTAYWYLAAPITLMGQIDTFISSTVVAIRYAADTTLSGQSGYYFTNNYDAFYNTAIYARDNKFNIRITQPGIYGVAPQFSSIADTTNVNDRGIPLWNDITWDGGSDNNTFIKECIEDSVSYKQIGYQFCGATIKNSGKSAIKNITFLSPDREDFKFVVQNQSVGIHTSTVLDSIIGNFIGDHFNIIGDSAGGYINWDLQWGIGIHSDAAAKLGYYQTDISNFKIQVGFQGLEMHGDTIPSKGLSQTNYIFQNTGSPLQEQSIASCANISSGTNTLTISGQPYFSWWNCRASDATFDTTYVIIITDGVNTYQDTMRGINSPTSVNLRHNCPYNFTNATLSLKSKENMTGDGHAEYINPGVSTRFINGRYIDVKKLCTQFQSSGGINPDAQYRYFYNCQSETGIRNTITRGFLMGHQGPTKNEIWYCSNFPIYTQGQPLKIRAHYSIFTNIENDFYDSSYFEYCSGTVISFKGTEADTMIGGKWHQIEFGGTGTGYLYLSQVTTDLLDNISSGGGIINFYCGITTPPTGLGVTNIFPCTSTNTLSSAGTITLSSAGYYTFNGTTSTWTLPVISGNTGVIYHVKNRGSGAITLNSNAGGNDIYTTSAVSTLTINPGEAYIIYNDGGKWVVE